MTTTDSTAATTCTFNDCDRSAAKRGYCGTHYAQWRTRGHLTAIRPSVTSADTPIDERYETYVVRSEVGCWGWTAAVQSDGYPVLHVKGKQRLMHRFSLARELGGIELSPQDYVLHACDNPICTKPEHLSLGDARANYNDAKSRDRHSRGERHGNARLSDGRVRKIRSHYASGAMNQSELAVAFGVSRRTIGNVVHRKSWAHLV